jgi:hypothetical protein
MSCLYLMSLESIPNTLMLNGQTTLKWTEYPKPPHNYWKLRHNFLHHQIHKYLQQHQLQWNAKPPPIYHEQFFTCLNNHLHSITADGCLKYVLCRRIGLWSGPKFTHNGTLIINPPTMNLCTYVDIINTNEGYIILGA